MAMYWSFYLPIAGHSLNIFMLLGFGAAVGFLSGLTGVGGGFLMTPILIMAGIPPTIAAASDSNQIVAATTSGSYTHYRLGNVDVKMGSILLIGGVLGGTVGVQIIKVLRSFGEADFFIKVTYVVMLSLVGSYMLIESIQIPEICDRGREYSCLGPPSHEVQATDVSPAVADPLCQIKRNPVAHPSLLCRCFRRYAGCYYGAGRGLYNGALNVLCAGNADACGGRHQSFSGSFRLCRCHCHAVGVQPDCRYNPGYPAASRFQYRGSVRGPRQPQAQAG